MAHICDALEAAYRSKDLGNKVDPVEELVYICLTRQTHEKNAVRSWRAVVEVGGPDALMRMPVRRLEHLLRPAGFARQKARWISDSLRLIKRTMGGLTLAPAGNACDGELEAFLRTFPGVGIKSAKCIMMYSMGRSVLPVDVHVRRIAERVGLAPRGLSERRIHDALERVVPPERRHSLHVNAIWHGRTVCTVLRPRCKACGIQRFCATGRQRSRANA